VTAGARPHCKRPRSLCLTGGRRWLLAGLAVWSCHTPLPCCCPQVEELRADVARHQARLSELEADFLSLDVVAHTEVC
jgi:hypothetical protein